jgi:heptosyltransferase-2
LKEDKPDCQKILVIRYRFIGDTILTVPFLRNLRYAYPNAQIDVLIGPQSGQVLQGCPYVNQLIEFDTTRFHKYDSGSGKPKKYLDYAWQLRKANYDTAFILKRSISSALLSYLIGAHKRIGYGKPGRALFLSKAVAWNRDKHEVDSTLDILERANIPIGDKHLEAWITEEETAEIKDLVPELVTKQKFVLIHAAAAHPDKLYPIESWAEIVNQLQASHGLKSVFTGAENDHDFYNSLQERSRVDCLNLAGKLTLRQSMSLYKQMQFSICVDSGPAHLSAAVGTPTLSILGPTDPVRWRPYGDQHDVIYDAALACRPCHYKKTCSDRPCLTQLSPKLVLERAINMYQRTHMQATAGHCD